MAKKNEKKGDNVIRVKESDLINILQETAKKMFDENSSESTGKEQVKESKEKKPQKSEKRQKLERLIEQKTDERVERKLKEFFSNIGGNKSKTE